MATEIIEQSATLANIGRARAALEAATSLDDIERIRDTARAIEVFSRAAHESVGVSNQAVGLRLRAEQRAGERLIEMRKDGTRAGKGDRANLSVRDISTLADLGIDHNESARWQTLATKGGNVDEYIARATEAGAYATGAGLLGKGQKKDATTGELITASGGTDEWYTAPEIIEAARVTLGGIDLDPASCEAANAIVRAKRFYSASDDGLAQSWSGRVFMNPPFSLASKFADKLMSEHAAGKVTAAVLLVGARTDTKWFAPLFDFPICFALGRGQYYSLERDSSPTFGSAIAYLGKDRDAFRDAFSALGAVVVRL